MAKTHTEIYDFQPDGTAVHTGWVCQHSTCENQATTQWNRVATQSEIDADRSIVGKYGPVVRNEQGPHHVAVFCCDTHVFTRPHDDPALPHIIDLDIMAVPHAQDCPAPDPGCECG